MKIFLACVIALSSTLSSAQVSIQTTPGQPSLWTIQGATPTQRIAVDVLSKIKNGIEAQQPPAVEAQPGVLSLAVQDSCVGNWRVFWSGNSEPLTALLTLDWPPQSPQTTLGVERPLTPLNNGVEIGATVLVSNEARTGGGVIASRGVPLTVHLKNRAGEVVKSETVRSPCKVQF